MVIDIIQHKNLTDEQLNSIAALKMQHWNYSVEKQKSWIRDNMKNSDFHVLMTENSELIGYFYITDIRVKFDNFYIYCTGIGNVCVDRKLQRTGMGKVLMNYFSNWLIQNSKTGILLCHSKTEPFYSKCGWKRINFKKAFINQAEYNEVIMLKNSHSFSCNSIDCIKIPKNF